MLDSEKPNGFTILPKPWKETSEETIKPIVWLGEISKKEAELLGMVMWLAYPAFLALLLTLGVSGFDNAIAASGITFLAAAYYATFLQRINFDIKERS